MSIQYWELKTLSPQNNVMSKYEWWQKYVKSRFGHSIIPFLKNPNFAWTYHSE